MVIERHGKILQFRHTVQKLTAVHKYPKINTQTHRSVPAVSLFPLGVRTST